MIQEYEYKVIISIPVGTNFNKKEYSKINSLLMDRLMDSFNDVNIDIERISKYEE